MRKANSKIEDSKKISRAMAIYKLDIEGVKDPQERRDRLLKLKYAPEGGVYDFVIAAGIKQKMRKYTKKEASIVRQTIANLQNVDHRPTRKTVNKLADILELNHGDRERLLNLAGYATINPLEMAEVSMQIKKLLKGEREDLHYKKPPISQNQLAEIVGFVPTTVKNALQRPNCASREVMIFIVIALQLPPQKAIDLLVKCGIVLSKMYRDDIIYAEYIQTAYNTVKNQNGNSAQNIIMDMERKLQEISKMPRSKK